MLTIQGESGITLKSLPLLCDVRYLRIMAKSSDSKPMDPQVNQLIIDTSLLKQKTQDADDSLKKLETKVEGLQGELGKLMQDIGSIKEAWGTGKTILTTLIGVAALFGIGVYINSSNNTSVSHGEKIGEIRAEMKNLQEALREIKDILRPQLLKKVSVDKEQLKRTLPEVKQYIASLKEKKEAPTIDVVSKIGEGLIDLANDQGDQNTAKLSWDYAVELASYRTIVDVFPK